MNRRPFTEQFYCAVAWMSSRYTPASTTLASLVRRNRRSATLLLAPNCPIAEEDCWEWHLARFRESDPSLDVEALAAQAQGAPWCSLVDGREIFRESNGVWDGQPCLSYHVYYAVEFLQRELPGAVIRPPVNREMQHCCILRAP